MSQYDLAILTGYTQSSISAWERGYRLPSPEQRIVLADALGVSADELKFELLTAEEIRAKSNG
jgi:transcriptional regulator with XRE-family HTH domain